jgi:hypothetical protein
MKILVPVLLALLSAAGVLAGERALDGRTLEKGTRRPLAGVRVGVRGIPAPSAVSDDDGRFRLVVPDTGTIELVATGPELEGPAVLPVPDGRPSVTLYLETIDAGNLPDIVVTAGADKDRISKHVAPVAELAHVAGSFGDPFHALQALPGVAAASGASADPAIRGSAPDDNAYYVDTLPVGYLFHMGDLFSVFSSDIVKDFTLYPSGFGPEYFNATGGVIDAALRDPRTDRIGSKVNVTTLESDAMVEGPLTRSQSFLAEARRSYLDLLLPRKGNLDKGVDYVQFPKFSDYQAKYLWRPSADDSLAVEMGGSEDSLDLLIRSDSNIAEHDPELVGDFRTDSFWHSQGAVWTSGSSVLSVGHLLSGFTLNLPVGHINITSDQATSRLMLGYHPSDRHDLTLGADDTTVDNAVNIDVKFSPPSQFTPDADFTSSPRYILRNPLRINDAGAFAKDRWKLADPFTLIVGGRVSTDSYLGGVYAEPRLGAEFQATGNTLLTAGWGRYHQAPEPYEILKGFGNPDLSHIRAEHAEAGLQRSWGGGWKAHVEGYYKRLSDLTVPDPVKTYVNGGSGTAAGAEFLLKKDRLGNRTWGWLSVSSARSRRRDDLTGEKINFQYDQPLIVNLVVNRTIDKIYSVGARWRFNSGSPFTPVVGTYTDSTGRLRPVYGGVGSERLPYYHRLDLHIERRRAYDRWVFTLSLDLINCYGNRNVTGYEYNADYSARKRVTDLPFLPAFGLKAGF